jgi:hypothetical protein
MEFQNQWDFGNEINQWKKFWKASNNIKNKNPSNLKT